MHDNLRLSAGIVAFAAAIPLCYVGYNALTVNQELWRTLFDTRVPELAWNTLTLSLSVSFLTLILGIPSAWIMSRYSFPGKKIWEWLLILPLAFPAYVLAYIYSVFASKNILLNNFLFSFPGVSIVIAFATYPYVYLLTRSALANMNITYEEAARSLGTSFIQRLFRVIFPILRPSIVAGVSLVILYVLADFGTVSMLRYQTFTLAIYSQMIGRQNHQTAAALSIILVFFSIAFVFLERKFRGKSRFYQTQGRFRQRQLQDVRIHTAVIINIFLGTLAFLAFILPTMLLLQWTTAAIQKQIINMHFLKFALNTFLSASFAATVAICAAFPLSHAAVRRPNTIHLSFLHATYAASSLPGPVAALALLLTALAIIPSLYGTIFLLIIAYAIRFLPLALQTEEASLQQITPNFEHAARSLGAGHLRTQVKVIIPLIKKGISAAFIMVFLNAIKELPATLLLRPVGFDTLAVRVWLETSDNMYELAAPSALLIMLVSLPALWLLQRSWNKEIYQ